MRMRCVGGPADGRYLEVLPPARDVIVPEPPMRSVWDVLNPDAQNVQVARRTRYVTYRRQIFRSQRADDSIEDREILVSEDLSIADAVKKLIEGYKP